MDSLEELHKKFKYRSEKKDTWTLLTRENPSGDCDDFMLTSLYLLSNRSWLTVLWNIAILKTVPWLVKANTTGETHMALWVRGKGWTCNIHPKFGPLKHRKILPYLLPLFLIALILKR